ncbi:MAG: hypothetical protein CMM87_06035 [Rickettsiales bacterium]|nr:hypothetical protein [Rickettsiales bacterium]|tara:strand:+ start:8836 stop:10074 length:1239 start_codon:yes stop_codon:yes gene_type:complete
MLSIEQIKKYRLALIVFAILLLFGLIWQMGSFDKKAPVAVSKAPDKITHAEEVIDPRETWTNRLVERSAETQQKYQETQQKQQELQQTLSSLREEINSLRENHQALLLQRNEQSLAPKEEKSLSKIAQPLAHLSLGLEVDVGEESLKKHVSTYVPAGTYVKSILLTGVAAPTTTSSAQNPVPILLRFLSEGSMPKGFKAPLKEARLIGACHGNISSERAECRIHTLTYVEDNGEIIEKKVEGWVIGEDGRSGLRGEVIDRSQEHVKAAFINGIFGGISNFFSQQATQGIYPVSPITGQSSAMKGKDLVEGSLASGTGSALTKLADYAIKRAEQMQPIIMVESGRRVDVLFKKGVDFSTETQVKQHSFKSAQTSTYQDSYNAAKSQAKTWESKMKSSFKKQLANLQFNKEVTL